MKQPRYQRIARDIRERILSGQHKPGDRIPSIREFAETLGCNKITVQRAFELLKEEHLIENRVGSGSYVRFPEKINAPRGLFDFRTDYLDVSLFPFQRLRSLFNALFAREKAEALAPAPVEGDPGLIRVLSRHYHVPARRMLIISGAQQGLNLVAKVFAANLSESMLFEDPTYPGAISLFKARHFVPLQADGPDLTCLDRQLQAPIRLFYSMPTVHNPTGRAYCPAKKEAVVRSARKFGFYIVEDDFLSDFRFPAEERFVDLCPERTIHIKSLSQTTVADIRLGFMVVPENLYAQFVYAKFSSDITSFGLLQRCMREFIEQGDYRAHLERVTQVVDRRKRRLLALLEPLGHLEVSPLQAGYSLWIRNTKPPSASQVPWSRGEEFSFAPEARAYFRLSFMHMDERAFELGLDYLARMLR